MSNNTRDYLLDTFRGLMLILMTIDHSPLFFFYYSFQPLGTFSAAEGFFYLSGFVFGMVYSKYLSDPHKLWLKAFDRIKLMYKYHILIFVILLIEQIVLQHYFNFNISDPIIQPKTNIFKYIIHFLLFLKFPLHFNIIPVYIIFFVFGPIVLLCYKNNKTVLILSISIGLWILSNISEIIGFNNIIFGNHGINKELRVFNPFSWQVLFVIGSYFGYNRFKLKSIKFKKTLVIFCLLYCVFFLIIRRMHHISTILSLDYLFKEEARMVLSPLRIINFFAFIYLIAYFIKGKSLYHRNYFSFIGSYSIYVFIFQIFLVHQLIYISNNIRGLSKIYQIFIAFLIIWSLTIPAYLKEWHKLKKMNQQPEGYKLWILFPKDIYQIGMNFLRLKKTMPNNAK